MPSLATTQHLDTILMMHRHYSINVCALYHKETLKRHFWLSTRSSMQNPSTLRSISKSGDTYTTNSHISSSLWLTWRIMINKTAQFLLLTERVPLINSWKAEMPFNQCLLLWMNMKKRFHSWLSRYLMAHRSEYGLQQVEQIRGEYAE